MKINVFLYWVSESYYPEGGYYNMVQHNGMDGYDGRWKLLDSKEVDFDIPSFDPREMLIGALKAQRQEIIDTATASAAAIEEKIQQLLALPQPDKVDEV